MELHEIEVVIDKIGQVQLAVRGVKGGRCLELTKGLEAVLGADVVSRELTGEAGEFSEQPAPTQVWQKTN